MNDLGNNAKQNWSERLGLDPDERMVEIQDIAARRAYIVLVIQMVLLGSYLFFGRGQTNAIFAIIAVGLSGLYLQWQHSRLKSGGHLDERSRLTFNHQFRYMNVALILFILIYPQFGGSTLWYLIPLLPAVVFVGTLLFYRVNTWRPWMLLLVATLLLGCALGFYSVLSNSMVRPGWIVLIVLAIIGGGLGALVYRRPRSM